MPSPSELTPPPGPQTPPARQVSCPACGSLTRYAPDNPHRPFCSARCRGVDLGAWADESYRVAAKPSPEDLLD